MTLTPNQTCDEEGFIKVERKKRKPACRNLCGVAPTGPNHLLHPAILTTPLYVSRMHYSTKEEEIAEYLRVKTKFSLRVAWLESRHNVNFNSFVVKVPTEHLATFMKEELWPEGVVFRRFRGRLPDTTTRHTPLTLLCSNTTPTQHRPKLGRLLSVHAATASRHPAVHAPKAS
ncbi:unnamed protein product [Chilo suppressalis]|uniref:Uncharacterized protein n=1 Tax=Chilo suppressalis TaxID=168631 RepID=A0ABN8AU92_CHISP|nr:unnamed protein product [Chilo suppressalis]